MKGFKLDNDDRLICHCGGEDFKLATDGETVMCANPKCERMFNLGQHLYSGCAESCSMLYPYEPETKDGKTEWWWYENRGSQDWRNGKSSTEGRGQKV